MAVTNFSPLLGLALPTTGDLSGTWGTTVNDAITSLIDSAVAGTTTLSTDASVTLTTTNGASNQARSAVLLCTGARTGVKVITAPAQSKAYIVINSTTGGYAVTLVGAGPTTPGVTVIAGEKCLVAWNGSDFVKVSTSISTGDVFGPASSTDNAFARFDSTTGKLLQNSTATLSDTGAPSFTGSVTVAGTSASGASLVLGEDTDNGVNTITLQAPSTLASDLALTLPTADGTNGQFLSTNGSGQLSFQSQASGNVITNTQTFTTSGTWTKPSGANWVQVVVWGAGGSGSANTTSGAGGGGGMYFQQIFPAASLSSTVTVTVGAGGTGVGSPSAGNVGGNTTFGAYATAFGGKGGGTGGGDLGGNGGGFTAGGGGSGTGGIGGSGIFDAGGAGFDRGSGTAGTTLMGGGGGGSAGVYSATNYANAGGASSFGGNGGAGSYTTTGTAGTQPAGGGGGSLTTSGAGGAGKCIVYTW